MAMTTVSVAVLKQNLSQYLHRAEQGEEILVTSHRQPVARVIPHGGPALLIRPPAIKPQALRTLKGVVLGNGPTAVELLLDERARR